MFISALFTGSGWDKDFTEQNGLLNFFQDLKDCGFMQNADAIMADKGFKVEQTRKIEYMANAIVYLLFMFGLGSPFETCV
jgi:hypothetical protein